jgi:pre-60S factor REI1
MHQSHSLFIPFQSSLAVDLHTLIWYLHMVIFSYRECICCGKRRQTVEAVQQHMTSTGHCRFDITDEMSEFYHMDLLASQTPETPSQPDEHTLRLPSGKLLAHRSNSEGTLKRRLRDKVSAEPAALPGPDQDNAEPASTGSQAIAKRDRQEQALSAQLAQLRTGDQMSLMHLSESQRRSQLAVRKKGLDEAKRAERRNRRRLDNVGNKTAIHTNYYKQEVPVYMGG